jgi:hypothetical protein
LVLFVLLINGCANLSSYTSGKPQNYEDLNQSNVDLLGDMPVPNGATILNDSSMMIGKGSGWIGKVYLAGLQTPNETYSFYLADFPKAGWTTLSATKSKTSILVFTKDQRTCTIELSDGSYFGPKTNISITSVPKAAPASTPAVTQKPE